MTKLLSVGLLFVVCSKAIFAQPNRHDNLLVHIRANVIKNDTSFVYGYIIKNDISSQQRMTSIIIEAGDVGAEWGGTIDSLLNPSNKNWSGGTVPRLAPPLNPNNRGLIEWSEADTIASLNELYFPTPNLVAQGEVIEVGFYSDGLPSIKRFWAEGWTKPLTESTLDSLLAAGFQESEILKQWYDDSFQGTTIAPQIFTEDFVPLAFLDTLISYKHQAFDLGWIKNRGIVQSLDAKLENAKAQLRRNNKTAARNILHAFVNEVEALFKEENQRRDPKGVQITSEAYALLKFNAEYLISKL